MADPARRPSVLFASLNVFIGAVFLFGAVLQYNDPEPLRWMAIYVAAAAPCFLAAAGRLHWRVPLLVGLVALGWSAVYAARGAWTVPFGEMFAEWEMKNRQVLETREMFGLLIIAGWMAVLVVSALRRRRSAVAT